VRGRWRHARALPLTLVKGRPCTGQRPGQQCLEGEDIRGMRGTLNDAWSPELVEAKAAPVFLKSATASCPSTWAAVGPGTVCTSTRGVTTEAAAHLRARAAKGAVCVR